MGLQYNYLSRQNLIKGCCGRVQCGMIGHRGLSALGVVWHQKLDDDPILRECWSNVLQSKPSLGISHVSKIARRWNDALDKILIRILELKDSISGDRLKFRGSSEPSLLRCRPPNNILIKLVDQLTSNFVDPPMSQKTYKTMPTSKIDFITKDIVPYQWTFKSRLKYMTHGFFKAIDIWTPLKFKLIDRPFIGQLVSPSDVSLLIAYQKRFGHSSFDLISTLERIEREFVPTLFEKAARGELSWLKTFCADNVIATLLAGQTEEGKDVLKKRGFDENESAAKFGYKTFQQIISIPKIQWLSATCSGPAYTKLHDDTIDDDTIDDGHQEDKGVNEELSDLDSAPYLDFLVNTHEMVYVKDQNTGRIISGSPCHPRDILYRISIRPEWLHNQQSSTQYYTVPHAMILSNESLKF